MPETDYRDLVDAAASAAAGRLRRGVKTPPTFAATGRGSFLDTGEGVQRALANAVVPQTPLDFALLAAGPLAKVGGKVAATAGITLADILSNASEAEAGPASAAKKALAAVAGRAPASEIARAASQSAGMTQPQLRALYKELGLTGQPASPLALPGLASQPAAEVARVSELKMADRAALNQLTPAERLAFQKKGNLPEGVLLPSQEAALSGQQEFAPLKKEITRAEKAYDLANAQGRAPDPFFDPSLQALSRMPDVEQFPLPRVAPKMTERLQPAVQGGLRRIESAAGKADPRDWWWYNIQEPLQSYTQILGPKLGPQAAGAWVDALAGTSMVNPIESNVRGSSYYLGKLMRGEPLPQSIALTDPETGKTVKALAGAPPPGYGAKAQIQHADRVRQYLANEADPVANPKPFSYRQNLSGNYVPRTIDTHDIRNMIGMPRALETFGEEAGLLPGEYSALERLGERAAQRARMPQAMQQGATWIGGADYTGLKSAPIPLVDVLNKRISVTAAVRGETPEKVWRDHVTGKAPLLSFGGAAVGLGAGGGGEPVGPAPASL